MADNIDRKRVTLHPLKPDGTIDESVNLYPKTFVDGVVDRDGNEVDIATQAELDEAIRNIEADLNSKTSTLDNKITQNVNKINHINQNIAVINNNITNIQQDVADIQASEATKEYVDNKFNSLADVAYTGKTSDLVNDSDFVSEEYLDEELSTKQDTLIAGENIIIDGNTISAIGGELDYATEDDIYEAMGIINLDDEEIEDTTFILSDNDYVDEEEHLADLDDQDPPADPILD